MRNHYVPRFYLRGFSLPEAVGQVWAYDKKERRSFRASVANVAVSKDFYDDEDEVELSQSVEGPGNSVLARIRDRELISREEKVAFSVYLGALLMRVPERRNRSLRSLPSVVDRTIDRVSEGILALSEEKDADQDLVATRLEQVQSAREQFKNEPPPKLVKQIRSPWPSRDVVNAIYSMRWRFGITDGPHFFLLVTIQSSSSKAMGSLAKSRSSPSRYLGNSPFMPIDKKTRSESRPSLPYRQAS